MSLYSINLQIGRIQVSIYALNHQLEQKREDLNRLEAVLPELLNGMDEYHQNTRLCLTPELTSNTWHGQMGTEFQTFRTGELLSSYQSISRIQLNRTITDLENEIETLKREIADLEDRIASQQSRLNSLYAQRREELSK